MRRHSSISNSRKSQRNDFCRFVVRMFQFIGVLLILIFVVNWCYIQFVMPGKIVFRTNAVFDSIIEQNQSFKYMVFGDSHPQYAFNPTYVDDSVNLASISENYIVTYFKLHLLTQKIGPNFTQSILIQVDPHSFRSEMLKGSSLTPDNIYFYSRVVPFSTLYDMYSHSDLSFFEFVIYRYVPSIGNGLDFIGGNWKDTQRHIVEAGGWSFGEGDMLPSEFRASAEHRVEKKMLGQEFEPLLVNFYTGILALARENNISVILVTYPHSIEFEEELVRRNISLDEYYAHIDRITQETYPQGYSWLNYYDFVFNDSSLLYDADHLNKEGAAVFSKDVAQRLLTYESLK